MTEYLYSISIARQTQIFLFSLGFGFIMGIFYDLFRILRLCISAKKVSFIIFDVLYCILLCFCSFLFILSINEGEVRFYILIGEGIGFAVYYFSLGIIVFSVSERIVNFFKKLFGMLFKVIFFPFVWIFKRTAKVFNKLFKKSRKNTENIKNKSNFLLKVNKHMLYNLYNSKRKSEDDKLS